MDELESNLLGRTDNEAIAKTAVDTDIEAIASDLEFAYSLAKELKEHLSAVHPSIGNLIKLLFQ